MSTTDSQQKGFQGGSPLHEVNSRVLDKRLVHIHDIDPKPEFIQAWEHRRPDWLLESAGEFFGVFFYCYAGLGATASMIIGELTEQPQLGSLLQVGLAYGLGIVFALTVCAMSSGGHFNPAITVVFALVRGFPWRKVPRYICAQLMGAFVATLVVYGQYRPYILQMEAALTLAGNEAAIFSTKGPAGIFAIYANPGVPLKWTFMNEFFADFFLGLVIWGVIDPSNIFVTPSSGPFLLGMAYTTVIWGYVPATVATNAARDLGCRLATIAIWGTKAWGGKYAAISALTSFLATAFAVVVYELLLSDSSRVVTRGSREVITNTDKHREHKAWKYNLRENKLRGRAASNAAYGERKGEIVEVEKVSV